MIRTSRSPDSDDIFLVTWSCFVLYVGHEMRMMIPSQHSLRFMRVLHQYNPSLLLSTCQAAATWCLQLYLKSAMEAT